MTTFANEKPEKSFLQKLSRRKFFAFSFSAAAAAVATPVAAGYIYLKGIKLDPQPVEVDHMVFDIECFKELYPYQQDSIVAFINSNGLHEWKTDNGMWTFSKVKSPSYKRCFE